MSTNQRRELFKCLALTLGVAATTALPGAVQAQQRGATTLLEEVVVTARRREESLQETPIAITALSGDTMEDMGIFDSRDIARFVPNMSTVSNGLGGGLGDNITIRGIGTDRVFPDSESGVGIYIDDVFFPRVAANVVDVLELERVEVLRGPQGTLFGRNSMAGTVRYVTKKPTGDLGGNVKVTMGDLNRLGIKGTVDFPLTDNWAGLISFGQDRRDGYITHDADPGTNGSRDNATFRGKLRFDNDRWSLDLGYTDTSIRSDGSPMIVTAAATNPPGGMAYGAFVNGVNIANLPIGQYDNNAISTGRYSVPGNMPNPDYATMDQKVLEATITYPISDNLTFKSISASTDLEYSWSMDMDESIFPVLTNRFSEHDQVFQQEFQLLGESERFTWQTGVFIYEEDPEYSQWTVAQGQEAGSPRIRDQVYSTEAWAVFGQGTWTLSDQWSVTAGVRYTDEQKDVFSIFTQHANPLIQGRQASNTASWSATTPMVSVSYQARDNLLFYGSLAEGFRSGGINFNLDAQLVSTIPNLGILPFDQEEATSIEFGMKWNSETGNVIANLAIFTTELDNQQLGGTITFPPPNTGFIGQQVNAGKSTVTGAEFEVQANVTDSVSLHGTLGVLDGKFDEVGFAGATGLIGLDSKLSNAPPLTASFGGTVEAPLRNGGALGFNFDYSWRDETQSTRNTDNILTLDAVGLFNASLNYYLPGDQLTISLAGTNLSDEYYFTFFREWFVGAPFGQSTAAPGRPREISLSASYRF